MILFALQCPSGHQFEAWFKDGAAYERQAKRGLIACPTCACKEISKAPMAPRISKGAAAPKEEAVSSPGSVPAPAVPQTTQDVSLPVSPELAAALRHVVESTCENVGTRFAEEARRIHYGEAEGRGIYGQAEPEETQALQEEGIEVLSLPWIRHNA
ncbi:MAG: DUF1178 family protein [Alphaproteobacteria bacterium]|nr:DUF1178 family protein [Alphaproteobacteria bacterium]